MPDIVADRGGLPWRDDTGICSCFASSWVYIALKAYKARSGPGASCFKGDAHSRGCGHLRRGQAPAWIIGKEHPLKHLPSPVQKKISISFTVASSSRMDGNSSCCGAQAIIGL
jgi:hypothetical protein